VPAFFARLILIFYVTSPWITPHPPSPSSSSQLACPTLINIYGPPHHKECEHNYMINIGKKKINISKLN
jgi:hypothetical protein